MRVGIIDLGTNSVRFDVHQLGPGARVKRLHREKVMIRLGQGVFLKGKLDREATRRALDAFEDFVRISRGLKVGKLLAFGTSALREADDSERFLAELKRRTGVEVKVISGVEEARLIALGVLSHEKVPRGKFALIDIGGGSTEISVCQDKAILDSESFPLGAARLQQVFLKESPPRASSIAQLRAYIQGVIGARKAESRWPSVDRMIGSSGTVRALSRLLNDGEPDGSIELKRLRALVARMSELSAYELLRMPHMEAKRVDIILAGAILLETAMEITGAKRLRSSEFALRDGILAEEVELFRHHVESRLHFHLDDLYAKAAQFGLDTDHLRHVTEFAADAFRALRPLHRLGGEWLDYLSAAVILRDTGEAVSLVSHPEHSCYIVRNADITSLQPWELELIAQLCLEHEGNKPPAKSGSWRPARGDPKFAKAALKLLALLRVIDALDSGPSTRLRLKRARVDAKKTRLVLAKHGVSELDLLRVERRKKLFEKTFKRALVVERG